LFLIPGEVISIHSENSDADRSIDLRWFDRRFDCCCLACARRQRLGPSSHADANARAVDEPSAAGCHAYQKGPDGSWVEVACHEGVETAPAPVHTKSARHHPAGETTKR
jgi:hypothetical protein